MTSTQCYFNLTKLLTKKIDVFFKKIENPDFS